MYTQLEKYKQSTKLSEEKESKDGAKNCRKNFEIIIREIKKQEQKQYTEHLRFMAKLNSFIKRLEREDRMIKRREREENKYKNKSK